MKQILVATALALGLSGAAVAQTSPRDLEVIGRALGFMEGVSGADRTVAVVFDPASEGEAQALAQAMSGGLSAGRVTLNAQLVPLASAGSLSGAHAAVLLGAAAGDASVFQSASAAGVMTVSTDLGCVQSGKCVMGVQSAPAVRILVNRSAADASSVAFAAAFAMMVEEL